MDEVRTRFAPSPTGYIHVGNIRTALFAWLLARHHEGKFILRIEDTDKKREVEGSIDHIIRCLKSLGLDYDEGPDNGGPYGPYRQSERLDSYKLWAEKLIDNGRAYADPYSFEEIESFRNQAAKQHIPYLYRNQRPEHPPHWDGKAPLRFKSIPKDYAWKDAVMGSLSAGKEAIDDFVLIKSDGFPTYNFAHIIDDQEMKISHVVRGNEFIASVPNYLNLYEALEIQPPVFATPPPVLGPDGTKKLSKRDDAKDILEYLKEGYLVEALVNFIASLGWNDGSTQEIFTKEELITLFSLERIQKSGARFDAKRLLWMNGSYIRALPLDDLYQRVEHYWPEEADGFSDEYKREVLGLVQERLKYLAELPEQSRFFFADLPIDPQLIENNPKLKQLDTLQIKAMLGTAKQRLGETDFNLNSLVSCLNELLTETAQPPSILFSLIRIATTRSPSSPPLAESLTVLGKERSLERISAQIESL